MGMMSTCATAIVAGSVLSGAASAAPLEDSLAKLSPEFRAHQVCILRGLEAVRREPVLKKADRMKTSIFRPAVVGGMKVTASGGAVRSAGHWYALSFSCELNKEWTKASSFTFELGREIPRSEWENLGLWQ